METSNTKSQSLKSVIARSIWFPLLFVLVLWIIKLAEVFSGESFAGYGIVPRTFAGLTGIVTTIFIHSDFNHLLNNTLPLLILGSGLMFFYRDVALKVFMLIWLMGGFWVWLFARESSHIGASGLIYGIAAFLFLSGVLKKNKNLLAISLLTVFLYGGLTWGIFPITNYISWEAHLAGGLAGLLCAYVFRNEGPPKEEKKWEDEDGDDDENAEWKISGTTNGSDIKN
jgi:membrane associated rhomboid family serine protease